MSKKMLKRSLALGALMAFVITGSAMAAEVNTTSPYVIGSTTVDFGILAKDNETKSDLDKNIVVNVSSSLERELQGVAARSDAGGAGGIVILGNSNTVLVDVDVVGEGLVTGLSANGIRGGDPANISGGKLTVNSDTVDIFVKTTGNDKNAIGLAVNNRTYKDGAGNLIIPADPAKMIINANNTYINVEAVNQANTRGLVVMSQGQLEINGNLEINAGNGAGAVLVTRGGATTKINDSGEVQ